MSFQWRACWASGPQELAQRPHSQTAVRVALVAIVDPHWELRQDCQGIRARLHAGIVPLESLDERLANAVALGASERSEAGRKGKGGGEVQRLVGGVGRAVVGEPLHGMGRPEGGEAALDARQAELF
jgi:hypothetical protein